jgi:hypothetical protein
MTIFVARDSLPVAVQFTHAGAKYVSMAASAFSAVLGWLYAAHTEKTLMRLAPTRCGGRR